MFREVGYALRLIRRNKGFALAVLLSTAGQRFVSAHRLPGQQGSAELRSFQRSSMCSQPTLRRRSP